MALVQAMVINITSASRVRRRSWLSGFFNALFRPFPGRLTLLDASIVAPAAIRSDEWTGTGSRESGIGSREGPAPARFSLLPIPYSLSLSSTRHLPLVTFLLLPAGC